MGNKDLIIDTIIRNEDTEINLNEISDKATQKLNVNLMEIDKIISGNNMLLPLSYISYISMTRGASNRGLEKEFSTTTHQSHVELLQALILQGSPNEYDESNYYAIIPDLIKNIEELLLNYSMTRLSNIPDGKNKSIYFLVEKIRTHTQGIRNWGYLSKEIKIINKFSELIDIEIKENLGYNILNAIKVFNYMFTTTETRINKYFTELKQIFRNKNIEIMLEKFNEKYLTDLKVNEFELGNNKKNNHEIVRNFLFFHTTFLFNDFFEFSLTEISDATKLHLDIIEVIINEFSLKFYDLRSVDKMHFFLGNPVWFKPIIRIDNSKVYCSLSSLFFNNYFRIISNSQKLKSQKIKHLISKKRSLFLENYIEELLINNFKNKIYKNVKWKYKDKIFETDLLLIYNGIILIIEAKSGTLSEKALRGEPNRIKRHINELIVAPINQADNMIEFIKLHINEFHIPTLNYGNIVLKDIFKILKLSITLEDFAAIHSNINDIKGMDGINDFSNIISMNLADFELVLDLFKNPEEKLHYLTWRNELLATNFIGNEIDLLGTYLENTFNSYNIENSKHLLIFNDLSFKIDNYFESKENNITLKRPIIKNTPYWKSLLSAIQNKKFTGWLDIWIILQSFLYDDQVKISKNIKKYPKYLKRNKKSINRKEAMIYSNYKNEIVIFLFVFKEDYHNRHNIAQYFAQDVFEHYKVKSCYVIGFNVENQTLPYNFIEKLGENEL